MSTVKTLIRGVARGIGLWRAAQFATRRAVRILTYHRFGHPAELRRQCEHYRRYFNPVTLDAVADWLHNGTPLPDRALAITVDDGYRDFLEVAQPVLREFDIPATVFPVSGFMDGGWLWWDRVAYCLARSDRRDLRIPMPDGERVVALDGDPHALAERLCVELLELPDLVRRTIVDSIAEACEVDVPASPPDPWRPLTWDEVRRLAEDGVDFGVHTASHPILSRMDGAEPQRAEIVASRRRLAAELGKEIFHFCYPNGRAGDFDEHTLRVLGEEGFRLAVTTITGLNRKDSYPLTLRRIVVDDDMPVGYIDEILSGLRRK